MTATISVHMPQMESKQSVASCVNRNMHQQDNLSAVLYKANDLRLEQRPIPEPKDNEVLLEIACVGICGSDVHYLTHGRIGDFILKKPMVIGHESSGYVVKVGKSVSTLKPGDRVAIEPGVPCRLCYYCKHGRYNLCQDTVFCATPPHDGNCARFYTHAADFCYKIPDHVTMEEAALLEPLSVGVHACRKAGVRLGSVVLIIGAGPIGLVSLITAKATGASTVIMTDLLSDRLKIAEECGADYTLTVKSSDVAEETSKKIQTLIGGCPDITLDCSGFESSVRLGITVTKPGGTFLLVGLGMSGDASVPLAQAALREVDIKGIIRYANDYPVALAMVASGRANVKRLITHNYTLEETLDAFETARTGAGGAIKVIIHCKKNATKTK